jgi:glycosyl-4,4'-diaponeurosporenoate acyltransferase
MLIELSVVWIIILNVVGWLLIQLGLAWGFTRMPAKWFDPNPALAYEKGGRFYERLFAIKRWKDQLPDAARWFSGGFAKATLSSKEPEYLARFIRETRRGELCHWLAIGCTPVFLLWNPWWGELIIVVYALAANLPCLLVQRYNRIRLVRILAARTKT